MTAFIWVSLVLSIVAVASTALVMALSGKASGVNISTFFLQGAMGVWALFLILEHHQ